MVKLNEKIRTPMNEKEFEIKWEKISHWLDIYLSKFPILAEYFYKWIDLAFVNGSKLQTL